MGVRFGVLEATIFGYQCECGSYNRGCTVQSLMLTYSRVSPFLGCLFGGILYDVFIYTGPSPINTPYFGLAELINPKKAVEQRIEKQQKEGLV